MSELKICIGIRIEKLLGLVLTILRRLLRNNLSGKLSIIRMIITVKQISSILSKGLY
jgi:hypothetical protein